MLQNGFWENNNNDAHGTITYNKEASENFDYVTLEISTFHRDGIL